MTFNAFSAMFHRFTLRDLVSLFIFAVSTCSLSAVECRLLGWTDETPGVHVRASDGERTFTVSPNFLSPPWTARADRPVALETEVPATATTPARRVTLAKVTLPPETPRVLLILFSEPGPDGTQRRLVAFPDTAPENDLNQVRLYNFTRSPVAWALGSNPPENIASLSSAQRAYSPESRRSRLRLAVRSADTWELIVSRNLSTPAGRRVLLFLRDVPRNPDYPSEFPVELREIHETVEASDAPTAPPTGG